MAGNGYTSRGGGYTNYNGMQPRTDDWNKSSYVDNEYASSDHVCRPVIIDSEGRKRPIIAYTPNHNPERQTITKNETIVEHVRTPTIMDYKYSSPKKVEADDDDDNYAVNKWRRPSSPIHDRLHKVEESGGYTTRPTLLGVTNWRNSTPNSTRDNGGEYSNFNNYLNRPSRNSIQDDKYDNYYLKNEPTTINKDVGWVAPTTRPLTRTTNDIGEAMELLKVAAKTVVATPPRFTLPMSKKDSTIDSREAARRYGNFNLSSRPLKREETYTGTIDSREATKRYGGTFVP